jgi:hypothetical protein
MQPCQPLVSIMVSAPDYGIVRDLCAQPGPHGMSAFVQLAAAQRTRLASDETGTIYEYTP